MNDEEKIRRLEIRASVLLIRFEEFLSKLVEKVVGAHLRVERADGLSRPTMVWFTDEQRFYGYKNDHLNRIYLSKKLLWERAFNILYVLFHEACHDLVFIHYFKGDLKKRNEVYLRFLGQRGHDEIPEEIVCDAFGREVTQAMTGWLIGCIDDIIFEIRSFLDELDYLKEFGCSSSKCNKLADELMKKSFELEAYIKKCMRMLDEKPLPKVHTQMIKDMVDFLKRHGYG